MKFWLTVKNAIPKCPFNPTSPPKSSYCWFCCFLFFLCSSFRGWFEKFCVCVVRYWFFSARDKNTTLEQHKITLRAKYFESFRGLSHCLDATSDANWPRGENSPRPAAGSTSAAGKFFSFVLHQFITASHTMYGAALVPWMTMCTLLLDRQQRGWGWSSSTLLQIGSG